MSTGFDPALAQRIVDRARNQIVRDVVEDLILEALLDDARRRLAGPEAGNARLARVVARDAVDLGVDDIAGNLDAQVLARLVDVDELGFHVKIAGIDLRARLQVASFASSLRALRKFTSLAALGVARDARRQARPRRREAATGRWCERRESNPHGC